MSLEDNFFDEVVVGQARVRDLVHFNARADVGPAGPSGSSAATGPERDPTEAEIGNMIMKFLVMIPEEDRQSHIRMMFHVEQAYWYYIDFVRDKDPSLRNMHIARFAEMMFRRLPGFQDIADSGMVEDIVAQWRAYSAQIPRAGGILLNPTMDKVLLIRGTKSSASWGFPRGKIGARDEAFDQCAAREVKEETGFDASDLLRADDYLELTIDSVPWRMYVIQGVDEGTAFVPECRGEIGAYMWFFLDELPSTHSQNQVGFYDITLQRRLKFYGVWEFIKPLKRWIKTKGRARVAESLKSKARGIVGTAPLHQGHGPGAQETAPRDAGRPLSIGAAASAAASFDDAASYPGRSWLEFRVDAAAVLAALDSAWEEGAEGAAFGGYGGTGGGGMIERDDVDIALGITKA